MKKHIAIIPARKGSKGLPGKNKRILNGLPLVAYSILEARKCRDLDIIVSSDDEDILNIARDMGIVCDYLRPDSVSTDHSSAADTVLDVLDWLGDRALGYRGLVLLQPTSPFRVSKDIEEGLELLSYGDVPVVGVSTPVNHPNDIVTILDNRIEYLVPQSGSGKRRQDFGSNYYFINGAFYGFSLKKVVQDRKLDFSHFKPLIMSDDNSIDIDIERDFLIAEALMRVRTSSPY